MRLKRQWAHTKKEWRERRVGASLWPYETLTHAIKEAVGDLRPLYLEVLRGLVRPVALAWQSLVNPLGLAYPRPLYLAVVREGVERPRQTRLREREKTRCVWI